jgi:hypothetical protein
MHQQVRRSLWGVGVAGGLLAAGAVATVSVLLWVPSEDTLHP